MPVVSTAYPKPLRWADALCRKLVDKVDHRLGEKKKRSKIHRIHEYHKLESYKKYTSSGRVRLERFERAFRYLFENSDTRLGCHQKRLVDVITIALLAKIFGAELVHNLKFLKKKYSIEELNDTVAIIFPRRSGKTEGSAIIIAVIAVSQPKGNCIMYNLTATQAKEFLQSVIKHLNVCTERSSSHPSTLTPRSAY
jgi:hypothetical protein